MKLTKISLIGILAIGMTIISCSDDDSNTEKKIEDKNETAVAKKEVIENYVNLVLKNYQDAFDTAKLLDEKIAAFVATPTEANFEATKQAWLEAREPYGQTEAFRFADGPIDDEDGPEGLLNAWPLDENYIDYVAGKEDSGIINNPADFPTITKQVLLDQNEGGNTANGDQDESEKNISVGYHAIEFLLWGQDNTSPTKKEAGKRPFTDFVDGGTAENQARRRTYLSVCSKILLDNLQSLLDEWNANGPYRQTFLALEEDVALKNMLTGISKLAKGELAGERVFVSFDNRDQEDEHSCFSDNTHRDLRLNLAGVANVYRGKYASISGKSLEDLIAATNATLGAEISTQLAKAETAVNATAIPFDFAISDDLVRPAVRIAAIELQNLGDKLVEGATALGLSGVVADLEE
ncbi:imelysin family protein [Aquimarina agarilytica]|uniref:imelysin family protein n=1 Tax=Aquimarina agarilytica TaxID=1087449 RepID=UPI0002882B7A|nr:imelysin family protein [Aquimarina agarilytica]